jgi:ATP-dependent DNA helicase RecG
MSLLIISQGEMNRAELMKALNLKGRDNFLKKYLDPALNLGLIKMTQPDSPKSPTQKYCLTEKGKQILENI